MEKLFQSAFGIGDRNNMGPSHIIATIYGVVLTITAVNGKHFLRGCQDIDPKCALLDEMRANGGMIKLKIFH